VTDVSLSGGECTFLFHYVCTYLVMNKSGRFERGMVMEFVEVIPLIFFGCSCMYEAPDNFMSEVRFGGRFLVVDVWLQKCRFNNTW